jgi:hypothetical protein
VKSGATSPTFRFVFAMTSSCAAAGKCPARFSKKSKPIAAVTIRFIGPPVFEELEPGRIIWHNPFFGVRDPTIPLGGDWAWPAATRNGHVESSSLKKQHANTFETIAVQVRENNGKPVRPFVLCGTLF